MHRISRTCPGGVARIADAAERLRLKALLDELISLSGASLGEHRPQELSTMLGGLARLGYYHRWVGWQQCGGKVAAR